MYICICNEITNTEINQAIELGADTVEKLKQVLNVCSQCGKCVESIEFMINTYNNFRRLNE